MFTTHNNPCLLPEELLPEDPSVDSKSTNAPLQRPDEFLESKNYRRFSGNKNEKTNQQGTKAPTERLLSSVTVFSKPGEAAAPWVKSEKECFQDSALSEMRYWYDHLHLLA